MRNNSPEPTSTTDGILRRPEVDPDFLQNATWDGRFHHSYVPPPAAELRLPPEVQLHSEFDLDIDPITYQVLRNRFWSINLDHSDTIRRVSGSPVIVYMDDFNTALLTETADLLMAGPSIQWFAALGDLPVKWTMENRGQNPGIGEGDVFFHNDPWIGCTHAMDVGMFAPVFHEGRIFSWIFSQCHVGDVGGPFPGSFNPLANDLYEEPALVPPIKLVRAGELQRDVLEMHTRKSRTPDHLALQMRSQMAGIHTVQARMADVLAEYGAATVKGAMRRMIRDCSAAIGERLQRIPDGEWSERFYMAGLGAEDRAAHRFTCHIRKQGDRLVVSNEGTDPQYKAASSAYGSWRSGALVAVGSFLGWDQLLCNAGALDHVSFEPTPGTLSVATYPAATTGVGGNTAAVYLSAFTVSKMLMSGPRTSAAGPTAPAASRSRASGSAPETIARDGSSSSRPVTWSRERSVHFPTATASTSAVPGGGQTTRRATPRNGRTPCRSSTCTGASAKEAADPDGGAAATRSRRRSSSTSRRR